MHPAFVVRSDSMRRGCHYSEQQQQQQQQQRLLSTLLINNLYILR